MTIKISTAARNAACDAIVDLLDAGASFGTIKIYDGTQPAGPGTAITSQVLLATFTLEDPAFGSAATGVATLDATPVLSTTGVAASTATWFRALDSNAVAVFDGSAGTSGTDLLLNTATISVGVTVECSAGTLTMGA